MNISTVAHPVKTTAYAPPAYTMQLQQAVNVASAGTNDVNALNPAFHWNAPYNVGLRNRASNYFSAGVQLVNNALSQTPWVPRHAYQSATRGAFLLNEAVRGLQAPAANNATVARIRQLAYDGYRNLAAALNW